HDGQLVLDKRVVDDRQILHEWPPLSLSRHSALVPCLPGAMPSQCAMVSPISDRTGRKPMDPLGSAGENSRIGTCSRVWSVPRQVGSLPWSAVMTSKSSARSLAI